MYGAATDLPRWGWMWGLAVGTYGALKLVTWSCRRSGPAPMWRHLAYLLLWPGMDADAFLGSIDRRVATVSAGEWAFAVIKTLTGVALLFIAAKSRFPVDPFVRAWTGLVGIAFLLHFGTFHILSCVWRSRGIDAVPLMDWPIAAESLSEFWGRRWNRAFRDLTHRFLFLPLRHHLSPSIALLAGFLVSGVVHDFVISVPAGAGYGRPTAYFLLQGVGMLLERSRAGRVLGLGRGMIGRFVTWLTVVAPLGWLFHGAFLERVILPFLSAIGGRI